MKKSKKIYVPDCYTSIDYLPVLNWIKIIETTDLTWLLIKKKQITKSQGAQLLKIWEEIYDEYIKVFGFGQSFKDVLAKKLEIIRLNTKMTLTKDWSIQTFIDVAKLKLENMEKNDKGGDIYKAKAAIEKKMGIRIPLAETSVREFYSYLKDLK